MAKMLTALAGDNEVRSPAVGLWRDAPGPGDLIVPGKAIGELEILDVVHPLVAPEGVRGVVIAVIRDRARIPVGYGDVLLTLDPKLAGAEAVAATAKSAVPADGALALRAPSSGRFYRRPSPDKPAYVSEGDEITTGQTVCLLEVMKTFNRVTYGGDGLPDRARVVRIVPEDQADIAAGDPILVLEEP